MEPQAINLALSDRDADWLYTFLDNLPPALFAVPARARIQDLIVSQLRTSQLSTAK